jgi:aryl-alcohol dehydrogenase-like predicted oxidoreductase
MQMRTLGSKGPEISVVGYGAWEAGGQLWGSAPADDQLKDAMRAAIDAGCNWIDTAEIYGRGRSEELVGQVANERRDEVLVFTKIAPFTSTMSPEQVNRAIRGSLRRLQLDHVDLYQLHWPTPQLDWEETWGAMAGLVDEGLTRFIGLSNVGREEVERCEAIRHVDSVQNQFSLLHQEDRAELLPWLDSHGVGYLAYGPLAFGLLTGAITAQTTFEPSDWRSGKVPMDYYEELFAPGNFERNLAKVERLQGLTNARGIDTAAAALGAALEVRGVTAVIAGSTRPNHVKANAAAGELRLDPVTLREIDRIFGES